jgi:hypothetical protein
LSAILSNKEIVPTVNPAQVPVAGPVQHAIGWPNFPTPGPVQLPLPKALQARPKGPGNPSFPESDWGSVFVIATMSFPGFNPSKGSSNATPCGVLTPEMFGKPKVTFRVPMTFSGAEFAVDPGAKISANPVPDRQVPVRAPVQHGTGAPGPVQARV